MIAFSNSSSQEKHFHSKAQLLLLKTNDMNLSETEHSSLNSELKELVEGYLKTHTGLTLNALAARSGVPATTLRRLMNSAEKKSEMAPHSVLALVSYLLKEKRISYLLKKVDGPIAEVLRRSFDQFIFDDEKSQHVLSSDLNLLLEDKVSYLIYKLAANHEGTTLNYIKELFGLDGLNKLSILIDKGQIIASSTDPERLVAKEKNFSLDLKLAHRLSHGLIDCYKPEDTGHGLNLFYSLSESLNEEGIARIKEAQKMAVKKIFEIMNNETFRGDIPYFTLCLSDVIGSTPNSQSNAGVHQ